MTEMYQLEAIIGEDKELNLRGMPFPPGTPVEVVVRGKVEADASDPHDLRGSVLWYNDPFEPAVPPEEWDALR